MKCGEFSCQPDGWSRRKSVGYSGSDENTNLPEESMMSRRRFAAQVMNGQLRFQESLVELEGRRVLVVLDDEPTITEWPPLTPNTRSVDEAEIEKDVSFRMPFQWEPVKAKVTDRGPLRPCGIVPEDLPND